MLPCAAKLKQCTLVLAGSLVLLSCNNDPDYINPNSGITPGLNPTDLVIAKGFDWATIRTVDITVHAADLYKGQYDYIVDIWDENPLNNTNANTLAKGVAKSGEPYTVSLSVPTGMNTLFIRQTDPRKRSVIRSYTIEANNTVNADFASNSTSGPRSVGLRIVQRPDVPEYTSIPAGAIEIRDQNDKGGEARQLQEGGVYKITGDFTGEFYHKNSSLNKAQVFVEGNWTLNASSLAIETGVEIILLPGATLKANNINLIGTTSLYIGQGATVEMGVLNCSNRTRIYNMGSMDLVNLTDNPELFFNAETGKVKMGSYNPGSSTIYNYGVMDFTSFTTQNGGKFYNCCTVNVEEGFTFEGGTFILQQGSIIAKTISVGNNAIELNNGSMLVANTSMNVKYGASFTGTGDNRSLIQTPKITLDWAIQFKGTLTLETDNIPTQSSSGYVLTAPAEITGYKQSTVDIVACEGEGNTGNPGDSITTPEWPMIYTDSTNYSFAYEDNWPVYGDFDMNDVIIYLTSRQYTKEEDGLISELKITGKLMAVGASKTIAAALQLTQIEASKVSNVTFSYSGAGVDMSFFELTGSNLESGHQKAVVPIFSNAHEFMTGQSGAIGLINTKLTEPFLTPRDFEFTITFNQGVMDSQLDIQYMDLFIITDGKATGRTEVHLPTFQPTEKVDPYLLGTGNCAGSEAPYLSTEGLSFALMIPTEFKWPIEYEAITKVYSGFAPWAQSSGTTNTDWYLGNPIPNTNPVEYEFPSTVYQIR